MTVIPDELIILIFAQMSYSSLLHSTAVCRRWRTVILGNILPCQQLFKIAAEPEETRSSDLQSVLDIQFHPVISRITYCIGDTLEGAQISSNDGTIRLVDLKVAHDFACIPAVIEIKGSIQSGQHKRNRLPWTWAIAFTATNPDGVCVLDVFSSLVLASTKKHDMLSLLSNEPLSQRLHSYQAPALFMKAEILGDSKYFAGFLQATRQASSGTVVVQTATLAAYALAMQCVR